jgi:hypothetical protein
MELRFQLNSGISCLANQHMNVVINGVSSISLPYEAVQPSVDLANFPRPIYQASIFPDSAIIVVPDKPTAAELRSAMTVAAGFGNLTSSALTLDLVTTRQLTVEQLASSHLILVGKSSSLPLLSELPLPLAVQKDRFPLTEGDPDYGVVEMVNSPWSAEKVVLVISGNTDIGILKASQAISTGELRANSSPNLAIVDAVRDLPPAPSLLTETTFSDLGYEEILLDNRGIDAALYNFYVMPGNTISTDAYLELAFGHSALLNYDLSGLIVLINDQPIGSVRFSDETAGKAINLAQINIPPSVVLPGNNRLEVRSSLEPLDNCSDPNFQGLWAMIWPESRLRLPFISTQGGIAPAIRLNSLPTPLILDTTLGSTALVLSPTDVPAWKAAARIASFLGDRSNGSVFTMNLFFDGETADASLDQYNLVVIGQPSGLEVMKELNSQLPVSFKPGTDIPDEDVLQVTYRIPPEVPLGYVEILASPWNNEKIVVTVLGNAAEGLASAASALVDSPLRGQLAGNFAVINGAEIQTADSQLDLPVDTGTPVADQPDAIPTPLPSVGNTSKPPVTRPAWILPAIALIILLTVLGLFLLFMRWQRTHKKS